MRKLMSFLVNYEWKISHAICLTNLRACKKLTNMKLSSFLIYLLLCLRALHAYFVLYLSLYLIKFIVYKHYPRRAFWYRIFFCYSDTVRKLQKISKAWKFFLFAKASFRVLQEMAEKLGEQFLLPIWKNKEILFSSR